MDEILDVIVTEDFIEISAKDVIASESDVEDLSLDISVDEFNEITEVEDVETVEVEIEEGVGWTSGDGKLHCNLYDRYARDQHLITSITGLREELNEIERLKTVYSDGINVANYYKWEGDKAYDVYGYFVSLVPRTSTIQICDGTDIFGVSVKAAGFIGGQDAKIARDNSYGLVVTSGLVDVRCELEINVGDFVVSNAQGYAKKSDSNFGYKVLAIKEDNGIRYAVISLGVQADKINLLGADLQAAKDRIDANEINITSAINVANLAYQKASETIISNQAMSKKVDGALSDVDKMTAAVGGMSVQVQQAQVASSQARAIAESASTSAASMKAETVAKVNQVIEEATALREEMEEKIAKIDSELDNTALELDAVKEDFNETINGLLLDTEGQLAEFRQEVSENYATTTQLAAVKTETVDTITAIKQEVSDTYATIESVAALKTESSEAIAGLKQEVAEEYATQEMLTTYSNASSEALSLYKAEVAENYATQEMVSKLESDTTSALTDYKQEISNTYATQKMVTTLETETNKALTDYRQEVSYTYAKNESLATLKTETTNAIAASEEKATATYASKSDLTTFESDVNVAMANIEQKADANGAYIQSMVVDIDKYAVGPYSQAYGFTLEQSTDILETGVIYAPTEPHEEKYSYMDNEVACEYEREFTPGYLYQWNVLPSGRRGWVTIDKHYSEIADINLTAPSVHFSMQEIAIAESSTFGYWYANADIIYDIDGNKTEKYEPYTLYKWSGDFWIAVATLAGNSQNRAISQVVQTATSIEASVANIKGDVAASKTWIEDNSTNIQDVVTWRNDNAEAIATTIQSASDTEAYISQIASVTDENGNIDAIASIVTAVNNGESSVGINADRIVMTGTTTFLMPNDLGDSGGTVISGDRITTGTLDAEKVRVINLQAANIVVTDASGIQQSVDKALADTLKSSVSYYALSTSTKTPPPDSAWSEEAPEKEKKKYMWQKTINTYGDGSVEEKVVCIAGATGDGPVVVEIKCSTGTIYINNNLNNVVLTAKAYQDNKDITDDFEDGDFLWEKYDMNGSLDTTWSYRGKSVPISHTDIYQRAVFNCILQIE